MEDVEFLYHYTNIDVLALILKNRTIRFNSLDKMDDLQEKETADIKNAGQFCYVSSWTEEGEESIPMWKMYTGFTSGIRIRLKKNPFKVHDNYAKDIIKELNYPIKELKDETNGESFMKTLIPMSIMFNKGFISPEAIINDKEFTSLEAMVNKILHKIEYTKDKDKLYPKLDYNNEKKLGIFLGKLGKHKNVYWKFQKEWRYIITITPLNPNQSPEKVQDAFLSLAINMLAGKAMQRFSYYDLDIEDAAFEKMEITLSPRISAGNSEIANDLIQKYNPKAIIKDSELLGLL